MDFELQSELDKVESEMIQEDIRDWSAYRRQKRREASERVSVIVITITVVTFILITIGSFFVQAHVAAKERAELVEMFEGGAQ